MRTSETFILGAIMGAAVVWLWGREMEEYVEESTRGVRTKAAAALRRADELLQDTKQHVSEALRVGEEAIGPAAASRHHFCTGK
jgi:hypothetical protein